MIRAAPTVATEAVSNLLDETAGAVDRRRIIEMVTLAKLDHPRIVEKVVEQLEANNR